MGIISKIYRPYIYSRGIYDFHIADSFSDFLLVPASFLLCALSKKISIRIEIGIITIVLVLVLAEFIEPINDFYDMLAAIISGIITTIIMRMIFPNWR